MANLADIGWHELTAEQAATRLGSEPGRRLTAAEAGGRLRQFGLDEMTARQRIGEWMRLLLQFHQPLIYILLAFTYLPLMNALFHSAPIGLDAWWRILAIAVFACLVVGVEKTITNRMRKRASRIQTGNATPVAGAPP